ncbi:MAG: hypothetical protein STSR0009_03560 [Methanoregula sp.]
MCRAPEGHPCRIAVCDHDQKTVSDVKQTRKMGWGFPQGYLIRGAPGPGRVVGLGDPCPFLPGGEGGSQPGKWGGCGWIAQSGRICGLTLRRETVLENKGGGTPKGTLEGGYGFLTRGVGAGGWRITGLKKRVGGSSSARKKGGVPPWVHGGGTPNGQVGWGWGCMCAPWYEGIR